jgi:galactokinase
MYRIAHGSMQDLQDVQAFLAILNTSPENRAAETCSLFEPGAPLVVARAPGRLDVMGGIADYSGSLVLQLPIREAALVALQTRADRKLRIVSLGAEHDRRSTRFEMPLENFEDGGRPIAYQAARSYFERDPRTQWAAYVAGAFLVLMRERGERFARGAAILIDSKVPEGKGVSSSAALEVSTMQAVCAAFHIRVQPREMALLCQKVENLIVGAPCGVMDQMTAACGETNRLLALLCQPAELQGMVELSEEMAVWGLDSGIRHAVSGADYGSVRTGAFMGYRIVADLAGLRFQDGRIEDPKWGGYLANLTPSEFEQDYSSRLPERMPGGEFLERYGETTDGVTSVDAGRDYAIRTPAAHPVYEHFRVRSFAEILAAQPGRRRLELLGELMYQSHASYTACGLGSAGTDLLVRLIREAGTRTGLYGAKITGGGSGGTVCVLGRREAEGAVVRCAEQYAALTGHKPYLFAGSSPGTAASGYLRLEDIA